jgi:hypothetical protein
MLIVRAMRTLLVVKINESAMAIRGDTCQEVPARSHIRRAHVDNASTRFSLPTLPVSVIDVGFPNLESMLNMICQHSDPHRITGKQ